MLQLYFCLCPIEIKHDFNKHLLGRLMIADESDMSAARCSWFSGDDRIVSKRNEMFQFPDRVHIGLPV